MATLTFRKVVNQAQLARLRMKKAKRAKPVHPSRAVELNYKKELLGIVDQIMGSITDRALPRVLAYAKAHNVTGDAVLSSYVTELNSIAQQHQMRLATKAPALAKKTVNQAQQKADEAVGKQMRAALGIDVAAIIAKSGIAFQQEMERLTRDNVDLISSFPEAMTNQLKAKWQATFEEFHRTGMRWEGMVDALKNDVTVVRGTAEYRAKLIARDQAAKMNASFNETRQKSIGVRRYRWSASIDERTREAHAEADGQIFSWDDPQVVGVTGDLVHPGEDIQCRCVAIPIFDDEEDNF